VEKKEKLLKKIITKVSIKTRYIKKGITIRIETNSLCINDINHSDFADKFDVAPKYLPNESGQMTQFILLSE
jgi:hypothetical protein